MPHDAPRRGSPADWLRHAQSDLSLAEMGVGNGNVLPATLCFHAQQAAEKALKAVLIHCGLEFPKTHSIRLLVDLLPSAVGKHALLDDAAALTDYAVSFRYPGESEPPEQDEVSAALRLAADVLAWARKACGVA